METASLTKEQYQKLFELNHKLKKARKGDFFDEIMTLLAELFQIQHTIIFVRDSIEGKNSQITYVNSHTISKKNLYDCADAYQKHNEIYESMKKKRVRNDWHGLSFTQDLEKEIYSQSYFIEKIQELGFSHSAVMYLSFQPSICLAICMSEQESVLSENTKLLLQAIRDMIYENTQDYLESQVSIGIQRSLFDIHKDVAFIIVDQNNTIVAQNDLVNQFFKDENDVYLHLKDMEGWLCQKVTYTFINQNQYMRIYTHSIQEEKEYVLSKKACEKYGLSNREIQIAKEIMQGLKAKEIAEYECISINTVKVHTQNIYHKLNVSSRYDLIRLLSQ